MAWKIRFTAEAKGALKKMDRHNAARIMCYLHDVSQLANPRSKGKSLVGNRRGLWRYRAGDYRIIVDIYDTDVTIMAVDIGHRSAIYRAK